MMFILLQRNASYAMRQCGTCQGPVFYACLSVCLSVTWLISSSSKQASIILGYMLRLVYIPSLYIGREGGGTAVPDGLHSRLCHAISSLSKLQV